jgi:hypothetical protein
MKRIILAFSLACGFALPLHASTSVGFIGHSGGTDSYGCHYNRKTGVYHCH